jgi:hypothetical protein
VVLAFCFAQTDTRPATVFRDELDTCGFESAPHHVKSGPTGAARSIFQLMNRYGTYASSLGKILLAPRDESACCSALGCGNHPTHMPKTSNFFNSIYLLLTSKAYKIYDIVSIIWN